MATVKFLGLFLRTDWYIVTYISRECCAFVFWTNQSKKTELVDPRGTRNFRNVGNYEPFDSVTSQQA